jgi:hypothetical protein
MTMVKGSQPKGALNLLRRASGEAGAQAVLALSTEEDREILTQPALALGWVPLDTYTRLLKAMVQVAYKGDERGLIAGAMKAAEIDAAGIYRSFSLIPSPDKLIRRLKTINEGIFQGISADTNQTGPRSFTITYHGFEPQHRVFEYVLIGWWTKMVEVARGAKPEVKLLKSISSAGGDVVLSVDWE